MPQSLISRGPMIAVLQQGAHAHAAISQYESSWGYADPTIPVGSTNTKSPLRSDFAAAPLGREDFSERLAELAAAEQAVAAAASACQQYAAAMGYAEQGRAQRKAIATTCDGDVLEHADFAERLQELVCTAQGTLSTAASACQQYAAAMGYAAPGLAQRKPSSTGTASPDSVLVSKQDLCERLAELLSQVAAAQAVAAFNDAMDYSQPAPPANGSCRLEQPDANAVKPEGQDTTVTADDRVEIDDMAERLQELIARAARTAPIPDCWQYAQPGRPQRKAGAAFTPAPLDLDGMAQRLAELAGTYTPPLPTCWQYAEPGRAQHKTAAFVPTPSNLCDMAERLVELTQRTTPAVPAVPDCWQYAQPGRPQRKAGAAFNPASLDLDDMAQRLAELAGADTPPLPTCWQYAEPGRAQRKAGATFTPAPSDLSDMAERLAELAAVAAAASPIPDCWQYALPGHPVQQRQSGTAPAAGAGSAASYAICLDREDFADRLQELAALA